MRYKCHRNKFYARKKLSKEKTIIITYKEAGTEVSETAHRVAVCQAEVNQRMNTLYVLDNVLNLE